MSEVNKGKEAAKKTVVPIKINSVEEFGILIKQMLQYHQPLEIIIQSFDDVSNLVNLADAFIKTGEPSYALATIEKLMPHVKQCLS